MKNTVAKPTFKLSLYMKNTVAKKNIAAKSTFELSLFVEDVETGTSILCLDGKERTVVDRMTAELCSGNVVVVFQFEDGYFELYNSSCTVEIGKKSRQEVLDRHLYFKYMNDGRKYSRRLSSAEWRNQMIAEDELNKEWRLEMSKLCSHSYLA